MDHLYKDKADSLPPIDHADFYGVRSHRRATREAAGSHAGTIHTAEPPPASKRDLRVLLSLRHKASQLSKGTVFSNPVEEAIRNRSNNALGKAQDEGAKNAREKGEDFGMSELKTTVAAMSEVEAHRRAKRLGVQFLTGSNSAPVSVTGFLEKLGLAGDANMSAELLAEKAKNVFSAMDADGSGSLDRSEIAEGLEGLGCYLNDQQLNDLLYAVGVSEETGKMTLGPNEFVSLVKIANQGGILGSKAPKAMSREGQHSEEGRSSNQGSSSTWSDVEIKSGSASLTGSPRGSSAGSRSSYISGSASSSSEGSNASEESELGPWNLYGARAFEEPAMPQRDRLLSAHATNLFADDLLQSRLKTLEGTLKAAIATSSNEREVVFSTAIKRGRLSEVATMFKWRQDKAFWTGPLSGREAPEGIGVLDYKEYCQRLGMGGERRLYYAGHCVGGLRQGPGVMRWIDETEYCGSWIAGRPTGSGVETYLDGSWYAGGFKDDQRHGMGGLWMADGSVFIGQWKGGLQDGVGVAGHVESVWIDKRGMGQKEEVKLHLDLISRQIARVFREGNERAGAMKKDVLASIMALRFDQDACEKLKVIFVTEFKLGHRVGSTNFGASNRSHAKLLADAVYSVRAAQLMGTEAASHAREGWAVRHAALTRYRVQERGQEEMRKFGAVGGAGDGADWEFEGEMWKEEAGDTVGQVVTREMPLGANSTSLEGAVVQVTGAKMLEKVGGGEEGGVIVVELSVDNGPATVRTEPAVCKNQVEWHHQSFFVPIRSDYATLRCVVLHKRAGGGELYLGEVHMQLHTLQPFVVRDEWFPLELPDQGQERVERCKTVLRNTMWRWFWLQAGSSTSSLIRLYVRLWKWAARASKVHRVTGLRYLLNINPVHMAHRQARGSAVVYHPAIPPRRAASHRLAAPVSGFLKLRIRPITHHLMTHGVEQIRGGDKRSLMLLGSLAGPAPSVSPRGDGSEGLDDLIRMGSSGSQFTGLASGRDLQEDDGMSEATSPTGITPGVVHLADEMWTDNRGSRDGAGNDGTGRDGVLATAPPRTAPGPDTAKQTIPENPRTAPNPGSKFAGAAKAEAAEAGAKGGVRGEGQAEEQEENEADEIWRGRGFGRRGTMVELDGTMDADFAATDNLFASMASAHLAVPGAQGDALRDVQSTDLAHRIHSSIETGQGCVSVKVISAHRVMHRVGVDKYMWARVSIGGDAAEIEGVKLEASGEICSLRKIENDERGQGVDPLGVDFNQECLVTVSNGDSHAKIELMVGDAAPETHLMPGVGRQLLSSVELEPSDGQDARCIGEARMPIRDLPLGLPIETWVQLEDPSMVIGDLVIDLVEARSLASNGREGKAFGMITMQWHEPQGMSDEDGLGVPGRPVSPLSEEESQERLATTVGRGVKSSQERDTVRDRRRSSHRKSSAGSAMRRVPSSDSATGTATPRRVASADSTHSNDEGIRPRNSIFRTHSPAADDGAKANQAQERGQSPLDWCEETWESGGQVEGSDCLDPRWEAQRALFGVRRSDVVLTVAIYAVGREPAHVKGQRQDGFLGQTTIVLDKILPRMKNGEPLDNWFSLCPRTSRGPGDDIVAGEVRLAFQYRPRNDFHCGALKLSVECKAVKEDVDAADVVESKLQQKNSMSLGLVEVSVLRARGLAPNQMREPAVFVSIGDYFKRTRAVQNNIDPVWDEAFALDVPLSDPKLALFLYDANPPPIAEPEHDGLSPRQSTLNGGSPRSRSPRSRSPNRSPKDRSPRSRSPLMGSRHLSILGRNTLEMTQKGKSQGFGSKFATKRSGAAGPNSPEPAGIMIEADSWRGVHFEGIRAKRTFFKFESLVNSSANRHHGKGMSIDGEEAKRRTIDSISSHISAEGTGPKMDLLSTLLPSASRRFTAKLPETPSPAKKGGFRRRKNVLSSEQRALMDLLTNGKEVGSVRIDISSMAEGDIVKGWYPVQCLKPHWILTCEVIEASGLTPVDLVSSDPYVLVSCGDSACQTPAVMQNCDPEWDNQIFCFKTEKEDAIVYIDVFDYNRFESHVFLGRVTMRLKDLPQRPERPKWYTLGPRKGSNDKVNRRYRSGEPIGSLKLSLYAKPGVTSFGELELKINYVKEPPVHRANIDQAILQDRTSVGVGSLEICAVAASIKVADKMAHSTDFAPACQIVVADNVSITHCVPKTFVPAWDVPFFLPVAPGTRHMIARVLNNGRYSSSDFLGEAVIFMDELESEETDRWYRLDGRERMGQLSVVLHSAHNLVAADSNGLSDPYVEIRVGKRVVKSATQRRTLDPVFEETFEFDIWSILDKITLTVYDWDVVGSNDFLGSYTMPITEVFKPANIASEGTTKVGSGSSLKTTKMAKGVTVDVGGYEMGEMDCNMSRKCVLKGLNGTGFVDEQKKEAVTGYINVEFIYKAESDLRKNTSRVRLLTQYVSRALEVKEAAEKEALAIEGRGNLNDAIGNEEVFDQMEASLEDAIWGEAALSRETLRNTGINSSSVIAQLELWKKHGGATIGGLPRRPAGGASPFNTAGAQASPRGKRLVLPQ